MIEPRPDPEQPTSLREIALLFLRLGATAFGGPAAHIAMMEQEVVQRRGWLTHAKFLDLIGAVNLIPGPNSTELAIHIGRERGGWRGLLVAGACFIVPATFIVLLLAWAYVQFGSLPATEGLLRGLKPVVIAIVVQALWSLGKSAIKGALGVIVGSAVTVLYLFGVNELLLLFGGGIALALMEMVRQRRTLGLQGIAPFSLVMLAVQVVPAAIPVTLGRLFLAFLKIGGTLYGSGYVLLAFMRNDFVFRMHWITNQQLLDAVSVGQVTPGPVFTTATFVGYVVGGPLGAVVATIGIFLPSFVFVAMSGQWISRLRAQRGTAVLLDGVNIAALGLMAGTTLELAPTALLHGGHADAVAIGILVISAVLLIRWKLNATWLLLGAGLLGIAAQQLR